MSAKDKIEENLREKAWKRKKRVDRKLLKLRVYREAAVDVGPLSRQIQDRKLKCIWTRKKMETMSTKLQLHNPKEIKVDQN